MFDVLVYVYEHYWRPDACPDNTLLARKLAAVGFENEEIQDALQWLDGLQSDLAIIPLNPSSGSVRILAAEELGRLEEVSQKFLRFLCSSALISGEIRELILDRIMAAPKSQLTLDDFKVLVLLVFWSRGEEPDPLLLDELFVDDSDRTVH